MATHIATTVFDNSSDANFRTWGKLISDRFAAFGWVKGTDTGQIDWATVLAPNTTNQARGYEIWRMADALQATAPCFMKIEYGSSSPLTRPSFWFTFGTGSDGAGNLTGNTIARVQMAVALTVTNNTQFTHLFAGDNNRFCMVLAPITGTLEAGSSTSSSGIVWCHVSRSKDTSGSDTAVGIDTVVVGSSTVRSGYLPFAGTVPATESSVLCPAPASGTGVRGTQVMLYPVLPVNVTLMNPSRGYAGYFKADIPDDYIIQAPIYGQLQTWYCVGRNVTHGFRGGGSSTAHGLAIRWE